MENVFYLKLLLAHNHCKGKTSEFDLRTVDGTTYNMCKETCMALGLLGDDSEWYKCLNEVEVVSTPNRFQNNFAMIVMENHPSDVPKLFQHYHKKLVKIINTSR